MELSLWRTWVAIECSIGITPQMLEESLTH